jgi:hypothetical protein
VGLVIIDRVTFQKYSKDLLPSYQREKGNKWTMN